MVLKEMDNMIQNGMSQQDFDLTRDFLRSYIKLYIQSPERQLGFLMDSRFYGRKDYITEMDKLLAKLTVQDVNSAMKKYWQTKNMDIAIVTDQSEAEPLKTSLLKNAPSPMSYSNTLRSALPASILEEDKIVERYPLKVNKVTIISSDQPFTGKEGMPKKTM
jgi:zinc protease